MCVCVCERVRACGETISRPYEYMNGYVITTQLTNLERKTTTKAFVIQFQLMKSFSFFFLAFFLLFLNYVLMYEERERERERERVLL